jgi:hypothetical protein
VAVVARLSWRLLGGPDEKWGYFFKHSCGSPS